jgi:hypothetical protein
MQLFSVSSNLPRRLWMFAAALLVGGACGGLLLTDASHAASQPHRAAAAAGAPAARAAHVLNVKDEGHLHLVGESGSLLIEEGPTTGTLPGTVKVRFDVGAVISASFTIYPREGGSITGHGSGTLHSTGTYATFGGTLSVSHGSGRFARAHGTGGLYGAIDRRTYALTVQTIGKLYY